MAGEKEEAINALESDMEDWEQFYDKYKFQLDKITDYERRIDDLEKKLAKSKTGRGFSKKTEREQTQIFSTTAIFVIAALIFMRIISKSNNQWLFFFGGLLIGVGTAGILKMWTM